MANPTPDGSLDADLQDRVVAWHNRSLLTCRIDAAQVTGIGVVALPFAANFDLALPGADSGRLAKLRARIDPLLRRVSARLHGRATTRLKPLFQEDFIAPLTPAMVARFARRHGDIKRPANDDVPLRRIRPVGSTGPHTNRYLRTAAIEFGGRRLRVLIGQGEKPFIVGPRLWNRKRLTGLLMGFGLFAIATASLPFMLDLLSTDAAEPRLALSAPGNATPPAPQHGADAAPPRAVVIPVPAASAAAHSDDPSGPASASAPAEPPAAPVVAAADPPAPAEQPHPTAPAVEPASASARSTAISVAETSSNRASANAASFALAAEPTRSRVSSMLRLSLLNFPGEPQKDGVHAELMQAGAEWRVVIWPYPSREAAEKAQSSLNRRGVKVELITF
ncbi:MAG: hypothetical protein ABI564_07690 [Ideonella sp.]